MKKIRILFLSIFMMICFAACAADNNASTSGGEADRSSTADMNTAQAENSDEKSTEEHPENAETGVNVLVAYFSATGTTKRLAEYAADGMNADLYEIVPQEPYSGADLNYNDRNSRCAREMNDTASRPAIREHVPDMGSYDIVFIGYPIWWGEAPRIISTFLENDDFSGKTIVPFCTSGSSGIGSSAENLHTLVSDTAIWIDGDRLNSSSSRADIASWINGLGLDIKAQ